MIKLNILKFILDVLYTRISGSIVVSMGACHALDPGSIPGRRVFLFIYKFKINFQFNKVSIHVLCYFLFIAN